MSIASMWDEKLKRHAAVLGDIATVLGDIPKSPPLLSIRYEDLRALVDDALELERLQAEIEPTKAGELDKLRVRLEVEADVQSLKARIAELERALQHAKTRVDTTRPRTVTLSDRPLCHMCRQHVAVTPATVPLMDDHAALLMALAERRFIAHEDADGKRCSGSGLTLAVARCREDDHA